ncbi:hypothetical protein FF011L_03830 [Roseimaritima multifibrata]|uniref:Uncharacterized protein n=1 Tax=Roseimaritima multifibrata TaxID=1930274 RepID=A0A517M9U7_9BACT|nr:hypothetical protein FF011L_03830 [Roseimaritima multifibrata]
MRITKCKMTDPASHFAFLIFHYSILILLVSRTASGIARHESVAALPWPGENTLRRAAEPTKLLAKKLANRRISNENYKMQKN